MSFKISLYLIRKLRTSKRDSSIWKLRTGKRSVDDAIVSYDDLNDDDVDVDLDNNDFEDMEMFAKRGAADSWKLRTGKRAPNAKRENLWHLRAGRK